MKTQVYKDAAGEWRWRVRAGNNRIVKTSGEGYKTRYGAELAVRKFLGISHTLEIILAVLLILALIALVWALATRTTENVQATNGTGQVTQQPVKQDTVNPQPISAQEIEQHNQELQENMQGGK